MRCLLVLAVFMAAVPLLAGERPDELTLMPRPSNVQQGTGRLAIDRTFSAVVTGSWDTVLERGVERFVAELSKQTGILLRHKPKQVSHATLEIHAEHGASEVLKL